MSLAAGVRLGPYEVTSQIGAGGMGEVWRATDNIAGPEYEVHPDGTRLLLLQGSGERTRGTLDMITNWRAELERRLPLPAR